MKRDFDTQRAIELTRAFFNVCQQGRTACEAMRLAAEQPCSRFWISPESARRRLLYGQRPKGKWLRMMLDEIERRLGGKTDIESVERVVYSPAPRFYMAGDTARKEIQRHLKRRHRCRR